MNTNSKKKKYFNIFAVALGVTALSSYVAMAAPQATKMSASINTPKVKGAYTNPNNINLDTGVGLARGKQIISVSLRDSDVKQALRMFADKAGLNIIFHNSVSGKITLDLVNVTLNDAFKMIMQMSDLSYVIHKDTIMVMSADASKKLDVAKENMSIIPVKYVDANALAAFLNKNIFSINKPGLSNSQIVVTNPSKNELLIFGTDNDYKMAKKIVDKLDVKPQATTYKVNHTTPKEMADLLCNTLFATQQVSATATSSDAAAAPSTTAAPTEGAPTGGAGEIETASPISPSSDSGSSASTGGVSGISLGGGVVACRVKGAVATDKLTSLGSNNMAVIYHSGLGAITIFGGSQEQINMVNEFIAANDRKQPQAIIEVSIVELSDKGTKEFDNTWNISSNFLKASFSPSSGFSTQGMMWKGQDVAASNYVSQQIKYLIQNDKARELANPKIIVTNGKKSIIDLTSDYVEKVDAQILASSGGVSNGTQKTYTIGKDLGIKVEMVPFISPDGYVSLNVKPNYSIKPSDGEVKNTLYDSNGNIVETYTAATLLSRRNLELSNVRIKDGETLVLGGLTKDEETQKISKVPVLGDVPVLGMFFRNVNKVRTKTELVIMITPRIIMDSEDVARI